jgi:hypothetical protein
MNTRTVLAEMASSAAGKYPAVGFLPESRSLPPGRKAAEWFEEVRAAQHKRWKDADSAEFR